MSGLKALVAIKRVIDYAVKIRVRKDGRWVETEGIKHSMNPFDEIGVEAGLRLKEQGIVGSLMAVTCGPKQANEVLRTALAMGVDSGIHVETQDVVDGSGSLQPLAVAKCLAQIVKQEKPDLVILGKQAIDDDSNQTGQLLAGLLQWPQATFASEIKQSSEKPNEFTVTREVDGGLQTVLVRCPVVITTDLRLNEPRYASLQNIMKAKQKPIRKETPESLRVDVTPRFEIVQVMEPLKRSGGKRVESVDELIRLLKEEAKVL